MQSGLTNRKIISFLKQTYPKTGFIMGLKIKYRSLICPFIQLIELVGDNERVGDVGCGSGQFLLLVKKFANPSSIYGIEINDQLITNARNLFQKMHFENANFEKYDGSNFPHELSGMDTIFLIDVLHHVPSKKQNKFISDLCNVLKPGAKLIIKDINASSGLVYMNKLHDFIFAGEIGNEINMSEAENLLKQNGLTILNKYKKTLYVYPHYTIIARK